MSGVVYLVRHAATELNADGDAPRERGWTDIPIEGRGEKQAQRTGAVLLGKAQALFASDLKRAQQTAKIIADITKMPLFSDWRLRSWNSGDLTGIEDASAKPVYLMHIDNPDIPLPGGESFNSFKSRLSEAIWDYIKFAGERNEGIAVVLHSSGLLLMEHILTKGKSPVKTGGAPTPGSILKIDVSPQGEVLAYDPTYFLQPEEESVLVGTYF